MASLDPMSQERSRDCGVQGRLGSSVAHHPDSLPPRPRHTFSLRTVERLQQQNLASTGAHVRPEQIPAYVERMRNNLSRVESALRHRAAHGGGGVQTLLSKFERVRVGQILADVVLDIVTISIASSNETYDAVVSQRTALSLATPRVDATPQLPCDADDCEHDLQHPRQCLYASECECEAERALPPISLMSLDGPSLPSTPTAEGPRDAHGGQYPLFFGESTLSLRFKPVLSMYSGAGSSFAGPPPPKQKLRRPCRYYDIDLQRLGDFTRCLRLVQHMRFTDSDFEQLGLRYAIPGIRELDRGEEVFFALSERTDALDRVGDGFGSLSCEDHTAMKHTASVISTGGGTDAETDADHGAHTYGTWRGLTSSEKDRERSLSLAGESQSSEIRSSSVLQPYKDHCLPLFRGGKETIVQRKDLDIFLAMVDMRLKQVDQEIGGGLNAARVDLPSSGGDVDTLQSATYSSSV